MLPKLHPKNYQELLIQHGTAVDRCNLLASPGMGKTASALMILQIRSMVSDSFPALAVGPLRVANSVWNREVEKWADFKGLRVVKVLGSLEERIKALNTPADIYTIHYGLLTWLHEYLTENKKPWIFQTVIADESTRLKRSRCSFQKSKTGNVFLRVAGSTNSGALARYAPRTPFWMNMTGTYTPNGLKDAWGQQWFVDFGAALGNSYDAYTRRWFYQRRGTSAEQAVFEPHAHAMGEITSRLKPTTISVDAYDYFDVARPREVDLEVELSDELMKDYRILHREAVLKLKNQAVITAVNAGTITNKCLQYASGHVYDTEGKSQFIHSEKLDRLEELHSSLNGAPLLVCYHFKPTRDAILKRFPFARILPSDNTQQQVEDDWNAGKIPMLVVHPMSAGHGLNLQYGGHNICIVDPYWDLELYLQVIERLGPVRQMQAGFDRLVSVYRILVKNTFDRMVITVMAGKNDVQETVKEALR